MFKDPVNGRWLTQSLFIELSYGNPEYAQFTLKDEDHELNGKTYISIKRLFLALEDPTEYLFATTVLGGWAHWKRLQSNATLKPYIAEWREELEVKLRSAGVQEIAKEARSSGRGALQAAKWLADKGWIEKKGAGRPTKEAVEGERKQLAAVKDAVENDLERITQH